MKRYRTQLLTIVTLVLLALCLTGCGKKWECTKCDKEFRGTAYYDMGATQSSVMCKDCAVSYWMPFPYENYAVR